MLAMLSFYHICCVWLKISVLNFSQSSVPDAAYVELTTLLRSHSWLGTVIPPPHLSPPVDASFLVAVVPQLLGSQLLIDRSKPLI